MEMNDGTDNSIILCAAGSGAGGGKRGGGGGGGNKFPFYLVLAPFILPAVGFTATGVAAGSLASGIQSVVYGGATTGVFSALQSAGAAGITAISKSAIVKVCGVIGAIVANNRSDDDDNEGENNGNDKT